MRAWPPEAASPLRQGGVGEAGRPLAMTPANPAKGAQSAPLHVAAAFAVLGLLALTLCAFKWLATGQAAWSGLAVALVAAGMAGYTWKRDLGPAAAWALIALMLVGLVFTGYTSGAYDGAILQLAPTLPALAAMLLGPRAGWAGLALTIVVLAALLALQLAGWVPPNAHGPEGLLVARFLALAFMTAIVAVVAAGVVATNQRLLATLAAQAHTDPLTGLANRRALEEALVREARMAAREQGWLSLLAIDVDWFKRFNDHNGHLAGDRCLQQIAGALRAAVHRPGDLVARSGGEEFVVVLPDTDPAGARRVAQSIAAAVRGLSIRYRPDSNQRLSVTIGVTSGRGVAVGDGEPLLAHADALLYRGKAAGRDRVVSGELETPEVRHSMAG